VEGEHPSASDDCSTDEHGCLKDVYCLAQKGDIVEEMDS
jgi:hypothetical protein